MKRYDLEAEDRMGGWASRDVMNERAEGDWIYYADHRKVVTDLTSRALEAGQKTQQANARIAELEAAIDKLDQCKGRYHTEAKYKALIEVRNKTLHK